MQCLLLSVVRLCQIVSDCVRQASAMSERKTSVSTCLSFTLGADIFELRFTRTFKVSQHNSSSDRKLTFWFRVPRHSEGHTDIFARSNRHVHVWSIYEHGRLSTTHTAGSHNPHGGRRVHVAISIRCSTSVQTRFLLGHVCQH